MQRVRRFRFYLLVLLLAAAYLTPDSVARADDGEFRAFLPVAISGTNNTVTVESIMPPKSDAYGKSLDEWMLLYWTWALGGDQEQQVNNVLFLPLPNALPTDVEGTYEGSCNVTLRPGTAFALPVNVLAGEAYDDGSEDDPTAPPANTFADGLTANVSLDGKTLIDTANEGVGKYYFGPVYFDPPIAYAEPQPRGDLDAVSVVWVEGIGFVHSPLKVGTHTLDLSASSELFQITFINTWTITVSPTAPLDVACEPAPEE